MTTELYPFLAVRDTDAAARFYEAASGAAVVEAFGPVRVLEIEGCPVGLAPEASELGTPSPSGQSRPARRSCSRSRTRTTGCAGKRL